MIVVEEPWKRLITTCEECECVFQFEQEDIVREKRTMYNGSGIANIREYVICPCCDTKIIRFFWDYAGRSYDETLITEDMWEKGICIDE